MVALKTRSLVPIFYKVSDCRIRFSLCERGAASGLNVIEEQMKMIGIAVILISFAVAVLGEPGSLQIKGGQI